MKRKSKHKAIVGQVEKSCFRKKKAPDDESIKAILKKPRDYMNIAAKPLPLIRLSGNGSIYIEQYKNIMEYTPERVKIQLEQLQLQIEGRKLAIMYFSKEDIKICGVILQMTFSGNLQTGV